MSGTIKGITIQLGADTTKLSSALNSADRAIKATQKELSSVEKALKLDPGNAALLGDKFDLLKDKVAQSKEKVDTLKEAQRQLDAQGVDKNSDQYKALQREIDKAEVELKQLEAQTKEFGSVGAQQVAAVGDKIKSVGDTITAVGSGMSKYVTAPIVGIGTASVAAFNEVHDGLETIIQKTGATGDSLESMEGIMNSMVASIPTDFGTAAAAIGEVNTRFGLTGEELETLSTQFVKFADLNGTDVSDSIDSVQKALSAYNLTSADAAGLLDRLNFVGQATGVSMDTLMVGLVQNGAAFQEMGLSIDQSVTFMGQLEKSGANSETAMQGLRKALKNATKDGIPLNQALEDLQNTILNGTDSMDGMTAAYDLFGKSGDQIYNAVKNGTIDFTALTAAAEDAGGSVSDTFNSTLTPADEFRTSMNRVKVLGADIGKDIMPMLSKALEKVSKVIDKLSEAWNGMSPEMQETAVKVALVVAAIGPLLTVVGKMTSGFGTVLKLAPKLSSAFTGIKGAFAAAGTGASGFSGALTALAGPVGIAVAAIAGITAVVVTLWKTNEDFRNNIKAIWSEVTAKFDESKQKILDAINSLGFDFGSVTEAIKAAWTGLCNLFAPVFEGAFKMLTTSLKGFMDIIAGIIQVATGIISGDWQRVWQGIVDIAKGIFNTLTAPIQGILTTIGRVFNVTMTDIKTFVSNTLENIKTFFKTKLDAIKSIADSVLNAIKNFFTEKFNAIKDFVSNTLEAIRSFFQSKMDAIKSIADSVLNAIKNFFTEKFNAVKSTVTSIMDGVKSAFSGAMDAIKTAADSILDGVKSKFTEIFDGIKSYLSPVIEWLKKIFDFEWKLPSIKLPHFKLEGEFNLEAGTVPHLSVDWYDKGGIFRSPTVIGVGEKRPEFVGALDDLREIVREESGGGALMKEMVRLMTVMVEQGGRPITVNQEIYAESTSYSEQQKQAAREFRNIARALT